MHEISAINSFFDFPDLSDSDVLHFSADIENLSVALSYDEWDIGAIDLTKLTFGADLIHDRDAKQASLDLVTGWDGVDFPLTLFTNTDQIALGFSDGTSWIVNASTFGKELAGLGLPVDENLELDLGFLFPDIISTGEREKTDTGIYDFFMSLRFRKDNDVDFFPEFNATAMTARIEGSAFHSFLNNVVDNMFGTSGYAIELKRNIEHIYTENHEFTVYICQAHIIRAIRLNALTGNDTNLLLTVRLEGEQSMLDHILVDVTIQNSNGTQSYHADSKGIHVPVNDVFTSSIVIDGFETGKAEISAELNAAGSMFFSIQSDSCSIIVSGLLSTAEESVHISFGSVDVSSYFGSVCLSGDLDFSFGAASSKVHDITDYAQSIADFELQHFIVPVQILWNILRQDQALTDIFGHQFITFIIDALLGEQVSAFAIDILGDRIFDAMDIIIYLLGDETGINVSSIFSIINELYGSQIGGWVVDNIDNVISYIIDLFRRP
jgi:hypothetical protein